MTTEYPIGGGRSSSQRRIRSAGISVMVERRVTGAQARRSVSREAGRAMGKAYGRPLWRWQAPLLDQPLAHRQQGGLGAVGHPQFLQYVANVGFDRLFGDKQAAGDLLVGKSLSEQFQDTSFTLSEIGQRWRPAGPVHQPGRDRGMQDRQPLR